MKFNYLGIDANPPKRGELIVLLSTGRTQLGNANTPGLIAWATPERDLLKERLQEILRGLPELRMVFCIVANPVLTEELNTAVRHYDDRDLCSFTELIRRLDIKAHNGVPCIPNFHN